MRPTFDLIFVVVVLGGRCLARLGLEKLEAHSSEKLIVGNSFFACWIRLRFASAALEIGSGVYAQFIGGFPFNDPTLLRIYGLGFLSALLGLLFGLCGIASNSPVKWKAPALSAVLLLLWFWQAVSE